MAKTGEKTRLLRIPNKLDKQVVARAHKNNRSVNSQIIHELQGKDNITISSDDFNAISKRISIRESIV